MDSGITKNKNLQNFELSNNDGDLDFVDRIEAVKDPITFGFSEGLPNHALVSRQYSIHGVFRKRFSF